MVIRMWRKELLVGVQSGTAIKEISMEDTQNLKIDMPEDLHIPL